MKPYLHIAAAVLIFTGFALQPAIAQGEDDETGFARPETIEAILACRAIADNADRLKCFDQSAADFAQAEEKGDVLVAEKEEVDQARREVFGLNSITPGKIFGGKNGDGIDNISATIASARALRSGRWILVLDNGARWEITETRRLRYSPKAGYDITIERGAFGSFNAIIKGQRKVKVKRIR